jgi:hypothetical protein
MCRRRFIIQEIIIDNLLHGGRRRSPANILVRICSVGTGGRTVWAHGLTVNSSGQTAKFYTLTARSGSRTGLTHGRTVRFLDLGDLVTRKCVMRRGGLIDPVGGLTVSGGGLIGSGSGLTVALCHPI